MALEAKKQPRLRTFEDVFHRMRWDDKYAMEDMTLGYDDRLVGSMEMPLIDFIPVAEGGDMPMHRVWYIRCEDLVLWDRKRKLDLVFSSGLTPVILAAGNGLLGDESTAHRIQEAKANAQKLEEEKEHALEVQLHAQRHAAARAAGALPCPASVIKKNPAVKDEGDEGDEQVRPSLILALFRVCDADGDGFLSMDEMHAFAKETGFDGSNEEWTEEFRNLCSEHSANEFLGVDIILFERLVNDVSESGCHCTDDELRQMAADMQIPAGIT